MEQLTNKEVAAMLRELADLLEISGENKYRVRAFYNASRKIMGNNVDLKYMAQQDRLTEIDGIGKGIAATIKEIYEHGYCPALEEIKAELPTGVLELIKIPGLGPKRAHQLFYELGITDIDSLENALREGEVRQLKGFGPKTEEKLLHSLENYQEYQEVFILYKALQQAEEVYQELLKLDEVLKLELAGSIRRKKELVGDIDFVAACQDEEDGKKVIEYFCSLSLVKEVLVRGKSKTSIISQDNQQIDLRIVNGEQFSAALQYFTGSKEHNVKLRELAKRKGYKLNEYGLFKGDKRVDLETEEDVYQTLGLDYIEPELREDRGEIEAAKEGILPQLVKLSDIKGDLHMHSRFSDGAYYIEEMVEAARKKGYKYIAITDHSRSLRVAHGMSVETLKKQMEEIDRLQEKYHDFVILKGIEVDIKQDGSLDYSDEILKELDLVIASIHVGFNQSREQITERIIKAMENPHVDIIAHPTGRLLKKRSSYDLDLDRVINAAAKTNTCLEINASPYRLDLNDKAVMKASSAGVKIVINTDSHHLQELDDMALGVAVARRGWLQKNDILNTMEIDELKEYLQS